MSVGKLIFLRDFDGRVEERIDAGRDFTSVANATGSRGVAILSLDGGMTLSYAALMTNGGMVSTLDKRFTFSRFVSLGSVDRAALEAAMPAQTRQYLHEGDVPPATWRDLLGAVKQLVPPSADELDRLIRAASSSRVPVLRNADMLAFERDATAVALALGDVHRGPLEAWDHSTAGSHFLDGLTEVAVREDLAIAHDLNYFGDWSLLRRPVVSAATFVGQRGEQVTVLNVNRTPIEQTTGVDLIYYHVVYNAYVLVQYKRMLTERRKDGSSRLAYRPSRDRSLPGELARMRRLPKRKPASGPISAYRLNAIPCYLKLCPDRALLSYEAGLVRGMYLPLDYFDLITGRGADVPRLRSVTYESAQRHLNNTEFIDLVQRGWIGSNGIASQEIGRLVRAGLDAGRSEVLAYKSS